MKSNWVKPGSRDEEEIRVHLAIMVGKKEVVSSRLISRHYLLTMRPEIHDAIDRDATIRFEILRVIKELSEETVEIATQMILP